MRFTFDPARPAGRRILEVMIGSAPLEESRRYRLATVDYLVSGGGDKYGMLACTSPETYRRLADVIVEAVRAAGTIAPRVEGRISNIRSFVKP
jgi:5'-nucleotidase